ncbi:MAG: hypothetical protein IJU48_07145 [Synergistaceae bacterium]|nr:hypothetical protein [Synergistaceae bacterium]
MRLIGALKVTRSAIPTHEAKDGYDLIEWLAVQDWCNGKVALSGTSYLAFSHRNYGRGICGTYSVQPSSRGRTRSMGRFSR